MKRLIRANSILAGAIAAALFAAVPLGVSAQDAGSAMELEEVIVTAQKREQAILDVPISVSVLDADLLTDSGLTRMTDYAAQVPGMSVTSLTRGYTSVVLRGISTGISQATPSTAFYIDEAPIGSTTAYATGGILTPDLDPFDLQRVEVLKGPQGTLYGAGAVGGLLRYVTTRPDPEKFYGAIAVGANTVTKGDDGYLGRVALNVPLNSDSLALRASAFYRDEAGWIDNPNTGVSDVNDATTKGGRLALGWSINDDWSLQVWGLSQKFKAGGLGAQDVLAPERLPIPEELNRATYIRENQDIQLDALNATLNGTIGRFTIVSSTTWQSIEAMTRVDQSTSFGALLSLILQIPNLGAMTEQRIDTERWSEELRLSSTALDDRLEYEAGIFYTQEDSSNSLPPMDPFLTPSVTPFPLGLPIADALISNSYEEYSFFGNASYAFTPKFDLRAGVRFSRDNQDYLQDYKLSLLTPFPAVITQSVSNSKTTYLLNANYKPNDDTSLYARVSTGYRAGGPSALPPGIIPGGKQSFEPDTLTSYELGYKADLMQGRASIESAIFTTDWEDIQIQTSTQTAAGTYQYFVNGGTAKSSGAELTVTVLPIESLTLRATGAYTNSELSEDVPLVGGLDGDRMPFVPKVTASLVGDYRFTLGSHDAWIGGSINYIGDRVTDFSQRYKYLTVPSFTTLNLNTGVQLGQFNVNLYATNLADDRGVTFINAVGLAFPVINPLGNPYAEGVIQPRTYGLLLTYAF